jgi:hypothetical protein
MVLAWVHLRACIGDMFVNILMTWLSGVSCSVMLVIPLVYLCVYKIMFWGVP